MNDRTYFLNPKFFVYFYNIYTTDSKVNRINYFLCQFVYVFAFMHLGRFRLPRQYFV